MVGTSVSPRTVDSRTAVENPMRLQSRRKVVGPLSTKTAVALNLSAAQRPILIRRLPPKKPHRLENATAPAT